MTRILIGAALLLGAGLLGAGPGGAASAAKSLTIYASAVQVQYVDHADDRTRGRIKNPFYADTAPTPPPKAPKGSAPGDTASYSFKLFGDPGLKRNLGTAVYSCSFGFKRRAFCTADYDLKTGTILAAGPADFTRTTFTLAVIGGTNRYAGAAGQVSAAPAAKDAQRLTFVLLG